MLRNPHPTLVLGLLSSMLVACQAAGEDEVSRMDQIVQFYVTSRQFMDAVLVAQNNRVLLDKGYSFANLERQIPDSPQTKFRLASITKQFTSACILLLEERGKLNTDDLLKNCIPNAPDAWDQITIYSLLTHTSGIPDFGGLPGFQSSKATHITQEEHVARLRERPLVFAPGKTSPLATPTTCCSVTSSRSSAARATKTSLRKTFSNPF